jgi:hypothetical protein
MTHLLAIDGGPPVRTKPWPAWPVFSDAEVTIASEVLASGKVNYWTGEHGRSFEAEYAAASGMPHAIALANGTLALELALRSLGIGVGDEVIVPCRTFIASASCVVAVGANPVLCDVDPVTQNATAETIEAVCTGRTAAVIPVHLGGMPCDVDPILELASRRGLRVVEDCSQAHGASYHGRPVGSMGDAAAFSFCQDKIITTAGEGGMLLLRDDDAYATAVRYKDHGKSPELMAAASARGSRCFAYVHDSFGSNYRMTELQSAIGRHQLARLEASVAARRANATRLREAAIRIHGLGAHDVPDWAYHAFYKCYLSVDPQALSPGWSRDRVVEAIAAEGIAVGTGSCPDIGRESAFAGLTDNPEARPNAMRLAEETIMLQVHPALTESDLGDAVEALSKVMTVATGAGSVR